MNLRIGNEGFIPTLNKSIDLLLGGGLRYKCISHFYGGPGTGKTNFAKQIALSVIKNNKEIIWIDTNGSFSLERIVQMADSDEDITDKIKLFRPKTIEKQKKILENLEYYIEINQCIKLIIIDVFTFFYRRGWNKSEAFGRYREIYDIQLPKLIRLIMKFPLHIIIINQVRGDYKKGVVPVSANEINKISHYIFRFENSGFGENVKNIIIEKMPQIQKKNLYSYNKKKVVCEINDKGMLEGKTQEKEC